MKGAGSLRSSAGDLLHFVAVNADLVDSPLWSTLQLSHIDREDAMGRRMDVAMGWHTLTLHGREIIMHSGATFGNMTFAGFDKEARRGVVVLSNSRGMIDDIGVHLLDPEAKLFRFEDVPETPQSIEIDIETLRPLEGEYALGPNQVFVVRIDGDKLYGSHNEGLEMELKAISKNEFFFEMAPHRITFKRAKKGKVTEIVFSGFGQEVSGKKLEFYRSPVTRVQLPLVPVERFVGTFLVDDSLEVEISRDGDELYVQVEGQLRMALIPTLKGFYAYEARAEIIFKEDSSGEFMSLTLHQDGEHQGVRIEDPSSSADASEDKRKKIED